MTIAIADHGDVLKQAAAKIDETKRVMADATLSADEKKTKIEGLLTEARELKASADRLKDDNRTLAEIDKLANEVKEAGTFAPAVNGGSADPDWNDIPIKPRGSNFKSLNAFIKAVVQAGGRPGRAAIKNRNLMWHEDEATPSESKDLVESVGASGGFLVTPEYLTTVMAKAGENSIIRSRATIIRMRRREIKIPVLDQTGTTANQGHWFGGIVVYWTEESGLKQETQPVFRQSTLVAHKMAALTVASDELLDDSVVALTDYITGAMGFPGAFAWEEDRVFLRGTGAGQPLGILNSGARIVHARAAGDTIAYDDLAGMLKKFLPNGRGLWVASQSIMDKLLLMTGPTGNPSYIWGPGPVGQTAIPGLAGTLLGYPIVFTEKTPTHKTEGDLMLIDPAYYLVGDRQAVTIESTIYDRFRYDETTYRAVERVGGRPWLSAPFTLADGVSQVSPFVVLGVEAS
jgi:HK97 family phage major capsid protein